MFHIDAQGFTDYSIALTCAYMFEADQCVGVCAELGTSAFADTIKQARAELRETLRLQLNEVERLTNVRDYLAECEVTVLPVDQRESAGFAVAAGSRLEFIGRDLMRLLEGDG